MFAKSTLLLLRSRGARLVFINLVMSHKKHAFDAKFSKPTLYNFTPPLPKVLLALLACGIVLQLLHYRLHYSHFLCFPYGISSQEPSTLDFEVPDFGYIYTSIFSIKIEHTERLSFEL